MEKINYIALGDSYTIGEGAKPEEAWPNLLVKNLNSEGWNIELLANPSVTGWTTKDLIEKELPVLDHHDYNFVSLLIGVNDWVQEVSAEDYSTNLDQILERIQKGLEKKENILMVTIPDFGVTPEGPKYSKGRDISLGIAEFNDIFTSKAKNLNLPIVDIYPTTQKMKDRPELIAKDGLHPSAKEYANWEPLIRGKFIQIFG